MRAERFVRNSLGAVIRQTTGLACNFICRTAFIYTLGMEYLGVSGLFSNVLAVLSLAELGLGSVLQYSMYKPMAEKDEEKLLALLLLYRKAYRVIACVITGAGLALIPFLPLLMKEGYSEEILLYYLLYLIQTVSSYFLVYKQSLLMADQKIYVTALYQMIVQICKCCIQVMLLLLTRDFLLYLLTDICAVVVKNLLLARKTDRMYPSLRKKGGGFLPPGEKKSIYRNVYAMFYHRVGLRVVSSTDNIVIASRLGLITEAVYDNHFLILNVATSFLEYILTAAQTEVGNILAVEDSETVYRTFRRFYLAGFWLYSFCGVCFAVLLSPFMALWVGQDATFGWQVTGLLAIQFFLFGVRRVPVIFKETMGLVWQDRRKPLAEAAINLGVSIWLAGKIGVAGVVAGTIVSMVSTSLWVEPYVLYRDGFHRPVREFWKLFVSYFLAFAGISGIVLFLCMCVPAMGWAGLFLRGMTAFVAFQLLTAAVFWHNRQFQELYELGKMLAAVICRKGKKE